MENSKNQKGALHCGSEFSWQLNPKMCSQSAFVVKQAIPQLVEILSKVFCFIQNILK